MILIIGYGNPLRSDDAIGQHLVRLLERRLRGSVEVFTAYQLTPELVEPVSHARLVIFIDARVGETPGTMIQEIVEPAADAGAFTHNVSPGTLLGAAKTLYGATPKGILISIAGAVFDYGSELSPELNRLLPALADQVEAVLKTSSALSIEEEIYHA